MVDSEYSESINKSFIVKESKELHLITVVCRFPKENTYLIYSHQKDDFTNISADKLDSNMDKLDLNVPEAVILLYSKKFKHGLLKEYYGRVFGSILPKQNELRDVPAKYYQVQPPPKKNGP